MKINRNYKALSDDYIFCKIKDSISKFDGDVIDLSIGDVSLPLGNTVTDAIRSAADEMSRSKSFRGYSPICGYEFLREAISKKYKGMGVQIASDEIFISDGAKSDCAAICEIFEADGVMLQSPSYPVYADANIINGNKIRYISFDPKSDCASMPPLNERRSELIYLCSPNNPTGIVYTREQLSSWIEYAMRTESIIIFDAAYEAYISGGEPHSIYEIDGAKKCAVEICSFSKFAGFTGVRCGWTVIPHELIVGEKSIRELWKRRISTMTNGVSYISQRAALAALSGEGMKESLERVKYYLENASILRGALVLSGVTVYGGISAPYLWCECPREMGSWDLFYDLMEKAHIVCTPGVGFGDGGEGYLRLSCFGKREDILTAKSRFMHYFGGTDGV